MRRFLYLILITFIFFSKTSGQTNPSDKHIIDSLLQNDDFFKMMSDLGAKNYFRMNVGIGNKLYGESNKSVESLQSNDQFVFSPSVGYYHKSGFGISFTGYLFDENNKTDFYQYTLSPSYDYVSGKVIGASFYYTHYFEKDVYTVRTSPIQNDFYGSINLKKLWLRPGISAGYSTGKSHEIIKIDTTIKVQNQHVRIKYTDSATIHLNSFSVAASVQHVFGFDKLFSSKDALSFIPQLSLITGINKYVVNHKSTQSDFNAYTKKKIKRVKHFQSQSNNDKYELQSVGLDLYLDYSIAKFYIEPELYLDYYLPKTNDKRFTQVFNLNFGITF